ncbi:ABC transporter permease protein [Psychromonas ingrahamii 37]|uniref:ABC transporter permease protein n=1 Tax=Psychromonas ingrahamii (strain DSM 17664 / CCUG 51855 / 37) TaxID=357804 RepID=A1T0W9_PSYIN|nr:ABC transporter permease [Psychromonas ingrahamii]ABM05384.1 ABC transporter permease protein [Psychromonas ingrahamii 37]
MKTSLRDITVFSWGALSGYPTRTILMLTAMAIGVASVIMLTALGEGARRYVSNEFSSLGTNLVIVFPGYSETSGLNSVAMVGTTPRDLTLDDAQALTRNLNIRRIAPINIGSINASFQGRSREVPIIGSNAELLNIRHWQLAQGHFLPAGDLDRATPVCVIGRNIKDQLFAAQAALGQWIRLGDRRFRVIGIMASTGRSIGVDVQDTIIIPVASAQQLFNSASLFRILLEVKTRSAIESVKQSTIELLKERHQGKRDVTVITQDAVLKTFDRILGALTYAIGGIAAISLAVAGILIMNVMLVAVSQRTAEIGLLKALGAPSRQIVYLILFEAIMLSIFGAVLGVLLGELGCFAIRLVFPALPAYSPLWAVLTAVAVSLLAGFIFSLLPAQQAARLNPVLALTGK